MAELKLTISGARGIVGESLTAGVVVRLGGAFAGLVGGGTVLIGRDTRRTGPMVRDALRAGLTAAGSPVRDCGICSTPGLLLGVRRRDDIAGGVIVTASHNPIEWNALKFVGPDGAFLSPEAGDEVKRLFGAPEDPGVSWNLVGTVTAGPPVEEEHVEAVLRCELIDVEAIRARRFPVVLDGTGGAGAKGALALLDALDCDVTAIHCDADGTFPRPPEPKPENLGDLCEAVSRSGAAVGFALDPDGDRLSLVSGGGHPLVEEATVALAVRYVLSKRKGPVVVNLSTSRASEDLAAISGVPFYRTPVGEAHVAAKMVETGAVIGGEGNGGVMLPAVHPARDALVGIALTLQSMADGGGSIGEQAEALPSYEIRKTVLSADPFDRDALEKRLADALGECSIDRRDGIRFDWKDRWLHVRASNTEPVVRIIAEAPDGEGAKRLLVAAAEALGG